MGPQALENGFPEIGFKEKKIIFSIKNKIDRFTKYK